MTRRVPPRGRGSAFLAGVAPFLVAAGVGCAAPGGPESALVIENVSVVPMDGDGVLSDVSVLIEDDRIVAVGPPGDARVPAGARRVDGAGRFLIPGLWDMHVHFEPDEAALGWFLAAGVTGARVMWGTPGHLRLRDRVEAGELLGPSLYVAGTIVEGDPPPDLRDVISTEGRAMVRDSADGARVVGEQAEAGYDFIKVYNNVPTGAYRAIVSEARAVGLPVAGHVPFEVGLEGALAAGQATIEHLRGYVWKLVPGDAPRQPGADLRSRTVAWAYGDLERIDELAVATRSAGVWNVPTLSVGLITRPEVDIRDYLASEEARYLTEESKRFFTERRAIPWMSNFTDEDFESAMAGSAVADSLIRALVGAGAGVMAGTDTPPIGVVLHRELAELVAAGLTPYQALAAATRNPAVFLGREERGGMITSGAPADLVLLAGNPLEDITNTRRIVGVVRAGRWLDSEALAALDDRDGGL